MAANTPGLQLQVGPLQSCARHVIALAQIRCYQLNSEMHLSLTTFREKRGSLSKTHSFPFVFALKNFQSKMLTKERGDLQFVHNCIKKVKLTSFSPAVSLTLKNAVHHISHFRITLILSAMEFQSKS